MPTVTLRLTPQRAHVRTARLVAAAMARRSGVLEELLDEVRLAVGEACGRAVQLHERHGITDPVVVTLTDDDRFEVTVRDVAPAKVPESAGMPRPAEPGAEPVAGSGSTHGAAADPPPANHQADHTPPGTTRGWEEPLDTGLGLALLDALVEDITVYTDNSTPGSSVRMSWPIERPAPDGGPDRMASSPAN
jgi:anti-sigma regulatory factor (Ser/Thr protein kinase)